MKIVVLAIWLLIINNCFKKVYAINNKTVENFNDYLTKCEEELGKSKIAKELRPDVINCALKKQKTIDEQDVFNKNENIANCNDLVSNRAVTVQYKRIFIDCIKIGFEYPGNIFEKIFNIMTCIAIRGIMSLILGI